MIRASRSPTPEKRACRKREIEGKTIVWQRDLARVIPLRPEPNAGDAARWLHGKSLPAATEKLWNYHASELVSEYEADPEATILFATASDCVAEL
jgi:hypothetical protein